MDQWNRINDSILKRMMFSYDLPFQGFKDTYNDTMPMPFMNTYNLGKSPKEKRDMVEEFRIAREKVEKDRDVPYLEFQDIMKRITDQWKAGNRDEVLGRQGLLAPWTMKRMDGMSPGVMY